MPLPVAPLDVEAKVLRAEKLPLPYFELSLVVGDSMAESEPGQFVMVQVEDRLEPYLRRAFSIFDVSREDGAARLTLLGKVIGVGTHLLASMHAESSVWVLGPLGRPFDLTPDGPVILVAGGVGSAALLLLAQDLARREVRFDFYYGGRSALDLVHRDRFGALVAEVSGEVVCTTEDGSYGLRGRITEPLEKALATGNYRFLYGCGPMPLLARVASLSGRYGVEGQVALETPMGCGYGACLGCAVPHRSGRWALCCKDGPVFDLDEIVW